MSHLCQSGSDQPSIHIDDLPSEILREIFIATYPQEIFEPGSEVTSTDTILLPLFLSHVSRRWRMEALSFGKLWSYLSLPLGCRVRRSTVDLFFAFLERTNTSPINFRLWIDRNHYPTPEEGEGGAIERMISALLEHQQRWKDVEFTWVDIKVSPDFRVEISNVPLLRSLTLKIFLKRNDRSRKLCPVRLDISNATRVEEMFLRVNNLDFQDSGLPKYELTKCCLHTANANLCLIILGLAPNLRQMRLTSSDFLRQRFEAFDVEQPEPHRLKELCFHHSYFATVIKNVHLPELRKLDCVAIGRVYDGLPLLGLIRRSQPPLSCLKVNYIPQDTMVEILRLLPTLVELEVHGSSTAVALFRALEVRNRSGAELTSSAEGEVDLCPRLRKLYFAGLRCSSEESAENHINALFSMVESRMLNLGTCNNVFLTDLSSDIPFEYSWVSPTKWDFDAVKHAFRRSRILSIGMV